MNIGIRYADCCFSKLPPLLEQKLWDCKTIWHGCDIVYNCLQVLSSDCLTSYSSNTGVMYSNRFRPSAKAWSAHTTRTAGPTIKMGTWQRELFTTTSCWKGTQYTAWRVSLRTAKGKPFINENSQQIFQTIAGQRNQADAQLSMEKSI